MQWKKSALPISRQNQYTVFPPPLQSWRFFYGEKQGKWTKKAEQQEIMSGQIQSADSPSSLTMAV